MMAVTELGIEKVLCPTISEPFFSFNSPTILHAKNEKKLPCYHRTTTVAKY
jgi:hypothetical protein